MRIGIVNNKDFFNAEMRIDPDIHLSEGNVIRKELNNLPYQLSTVGENATDVFYGNIFSRIFVKKPERGMTYLAASDTVLANLETGRYLSNYQAATLSYLILKKDWILVTCSGTLGNVTYTNRNFENHIATHDLIRILPNSKKVNKGTLYAFLAGKFGYYQITQSQFGGVVKHINTEQTKSIIVPIFPEVFQEKIDEMIQKSARLREEATESLNEAKELLSDYIGAKFNKIYFKTSSVKSQEIFSSLQQRLDPPALMNDGVFAMKEVCDRLPYKPIKDIDCHAFRPGIFKRIYVENGIPYIKGSEIFMTNPFRRCEHLSRTRTPFIDEMAMKEGQILITCAGSVGDIKLITKEYEDKKSIGSQDIIRLESSDSLFTREYLFVYLQQPFVYDYIQSMKYGSVIERIEPFHIESIPVVEPTKDLSDKITSIIRKYMECTYKAFNAEEKAITMVEEEIEKWNN